MAKQYFENNVSATLVRNASSTDTVLYFDDVSMFPNVTSGDFFLLTIFSAAALGVESNWEVVKVTAVNYSDKSVTCQRGYEIGASVHVAGELAQMRTTARTLNVLRDSIGDISGENGADLVGIGSGRTQADKNAEVVSVRDYIATAVDGVTSNQDGIVAAVAAAYAAGDDLYWPRGTYVSDANIQNLHDVKHYGPGVLKRGSDTWVISGKTGTCSLYVSTTGNDANDGLSASQPKLTAQSAANALTNWASALMGNATFRVNFAAGTYAGELNASGLRSKNRIQFRGVSVGGHPNVPTVVVDGTGIGAIGWYFQNRMFIQVQDIKFQNWKIHGLSAEAMSNVYTVNVHTFNNGADISAGSNGSGINTEVQSRSYISGGVHNNPNNSFRVYANSVATIGYDGDVSTNRPQISGASGGAAGVLVRDSSSAHIDYCDITGCTGAGGIYALNQTRVHILGCSVTGNTYGVRIAANSTYINSGSTISGNTLKDVLQFGMSINNEDLDRWYYDVAVKKFRVGLTSNVSPQALMHFIDGAGAGAIGYNSNSRLIAESDASTHIVMGTPGGSVESAIVAAKPSAPQQGKFAYNFNDDTWRLSVGAAEAFRFTSTALLPLADNTKAAGGGSNRLTQVFAVSGTINTSDGREKTEPLPIDDSVLDAWGDVQLITFQWLDSIQQKGDDAARWHFGVIAQQVRDSFAAHGLDGTRYGLLCYDEWDDQYEPVMAMRDVEREVTEVVGVDYDGSPIEQTRLVVEQEEYDTGEVRLAQAAGNRWGIRADQCLFLEAAYQRRRCDRIEQRLIELENK